MSKAILGQRPSVLAALACGLIGTACGLDVNGLGPASSDDPAVSAGGGAGSDTSAAPPPISTPSKSFDAGAISTSKPDSGGGAPTTGTSTDSGAGTILVADASQSVGTDASAAGDSATSPDSAATAPLAADAGPPAGSWCQAHQTATQFCRDFDDGSPLASGFSNVFAAPADVGSISSLDSAPGSPPSSALFAVPALAGLVTEQDQLNYAFPTTASAVSAQFALKVANLDLGAPNLSFVRFARADGTWSISLDLIVGAWELLETRTSNAGPSSASHPLSAPMLGAWTTIEIDVDTGNRTVAVLYDGAKVLSDPLSQLPMSRGNGMGGTNGGQNSALTVTLGVNFDQGPAGAMTIQYDNILLTPAQ